MIATFTAKLVELAQHVPLELFTFLGSFVEEVVAPIPSPIVMTMTGSIASAQGKVMAYLLILSLIGAAGKTIGAWIVYLVSDKAEDLLIGRFGKVIGVTHAEIESLGRRFKGGWKDFGFLLFLRALPIMSSAVVSIASGVIKVPQTIYLPATFVGTIIRDFFSLYVGFTGIAALHGLVEGFDSVESIIQMTIGVLIVMVIGYLYWRRGRGRKIVE